MLFNLVHFISWRCLGFLFRVFLRNRKIFQTTSDNSFDLHKIIIMVHHPIKFISLLQFLKFWWFWLKDLRIEEITATFLVSGFVTRSCEFPSGIIFYNFFQFSVWFEGSFGFVESYCIFNDCSIYLELQKRTRIIKQYISWAEIQNKVTII